MKKIVKLTESDLMRIIKKVIKENNGTIKDKKYYKLNEAQGRCEPPVRFDMGSTSCVAAAGWYECGQGCCCCKLSQKPGSQVYKNCLTDDTLK